MELYQARVNNTDLHILEFNPTDEKIVLTSVGLSTAQPLSKIRHNWLEEKGYKCVAKANAMFFSWITGKTVGLDYRDSGFTLGDTTYNDEFNELIYSEGKLIIDDIVSTDIKTKYPKANWVSSLGYTLVIDGKINLKKSSLYDHATVPNPRTMIGQKLDGTIVLAVTDGRGTDDTGLTAQQQAEFMLAKGCHLAINCDGGGSSELIFKDIIQNELDGGERSIPQALLLYQKEEDIRMKVCLDAGHGLYTAGKRTPDGVHEAEQNYPIMFKVAEYLKYNKIDVCYTNTNIKYDMSLEDRVAKEKKSGADIFVSIHKNAMGTTWQTSAKGIEQFVVFNGGRAETLSKAIYKHLIADTGMYARGLKTANFYVVKYTKAPAVLLELGFMDNPVEAAQMKDPKWHDKYAKAIVKGIGEYFGKTVSFPEVVVPVPDDEPKTWQQILGEEAIDGLAAKGLINTPDEWKAKNLTDKAELWTVFTLLDRIAEAIK